jgi:hypothetical protein
MMMERSKEERALPHVDQSLKRGTSFGHMMFISQRNILKSNFENLLIIIEGPKTQQTKL